MPDYNFAPINVTPPPQTSLGDMMSIARGAQAYQQSQQLNPLQLQQQRELTEQARLSTEKAKRTLEPEVSRTESLAEQAHIETMVKKFGLNKEETNEFNAILGGYANDKRLKPENLKNDPTGAVDVMNEIHEAAINKGIRKDRVNIISAPAISLAAKNPLALSQYIENMKQAGLGASGQVDLTKPSTGTNAAGQTVAQNAVTGKMEIMGTPQTNPTASDIVEVNGVKYLKDPITKNLVPLREAQTAAPTSTPVANVAPQAGNLQSQFTNKQAVAQPLVKDIYNLPKGTLQLNTQQKSLYDKGDELYNKSVNASNLAKDSGQTLRKIEENLGAATGSRPEQLLRDASGWVAGNQQLEELVKNLAQNQLQQAQIMGLNTDASRGVSNLANGSENITRGALKDIKERAAATNTAFSKFQQAYGKFVESRGDLGGKVNFQAFQNAWSDNFDPRIFMVQNINASNLSEHAKTEEIRKLTGSLSNEQIAELQVKARNLKRLEKGDF